MLKRDSGQPRLGILISRRHSPAAVVRNGLKRCVREAFRLEQDGLGALDLLVRPPFGAKPSPEMMRNLRRMLRGLHG